jgi:hypothetical protein
MKNIQTKSIWVDGSDKNATQLNVYSVFDNLQNMSRFQYELCDADNLVLSKGLINMEGQDYIDWSSTIDINLAAYQWVASKLNLVLL